MQNYALECQIIVAARFYYKQRNRAKPLQSGRFEAWPEHCIYEYQLSNTRRISFEHESQMQYM